MEIQDIEKLAKLARIELTEQEKQKYLKDIGSILAYVDQIKGIVAQTGEERTAGDLRNVMRVDEISTTDSVDLIAEFPHQERSYLKVKKILDN